MSTIQKIGLIFSGLVFIPALIYTNYLVVGDFFKAEKSKAWHLDDYLFFKNLILWLGFHPIFRGLNLIKNSHTTR